MNEASKPRTKRAVPWRGRKRVKDPRGRFIAVRCSEEEYAAISKAAEQAGLAVSAFLRAQALGEPGPRSVRRPPLERRELARLHGQLGKVGSNINQLAHAYNRTKLMPGFPEILAVRKDIAEMSAALMKALGYGD
jgi:Bacterial mobilisation protein (MobC)